MFQGIWRQDFPLLASWLAAGRNLQRRGNPCLDLGARATLVCLLMKLLHSCCRITPVKLFVALTFSHMPCLDGIDGFDHFSLDGLRWMQTVYNFCYNVCYIVGFVNLVLFPYWTALFFSPAECFQVAEVTSDVFTLTRVLAVLAKKQLGLAKVLFLMLYWQCQLPKDITGENRVGCCCCWPIQKQAASSKDINFV